MSIDNLITDKNLKIVYGKQENKIHRKLVDFISNIEKRQILIIDMKRIWQPEITNKRIKYIQPTSKTNLIRLIYNLHEFINPRLELIIIDGMLMFLRDYIGKSARANAVNTKFYAMCLSILKNMADNFNINIIITSQEWSINDSKPILYEINKYYNLMELKI